MATAPKPVIFIDIGGESRPLRFGMMALADFSDETGLPLVQLATLSLATMSVRQFIMLVWSGLKDGARKEQRSFRFAASENGAEREEAITVEDVGDWLDEVEDATTEQIFTHYMRSIVSDKKEQPGKKTKRRTKAAKPPQTSETS
jgi:hypothetical protein